MKLNNIKTYIGAAALALSMSCVSTCAAVHFGQGCPLQ